MKNLIINIVNRIRYKPSRDMSGLVIVFFGATGKVGSVLASYFYDKGASIALFGRDSLKLKRSITNFSSESGLLFSGDVCDEIQVKRFLLKVIEKFGKIDAIVNSTGQFDALNIKDITSKSIDQAYEANFKSIVIPSKVALSILRKGSTIINFGSYIVKNKNVRKGKALYVAFKSAVDGFSRVFSIEANTKGIRFICLEPATISNFVTKDFLYYINPFRLAELIEYVLKFEDIDFGVMTIKSVNQKI